MGAGFFFERHVLEEVDQLISATRRREMAQAHEISHKRFTYGSRAPASSKKFCGFGDPVTLLPKLIADKKHEENLMHPRVLMQVKDFADLDQ